MPFSSFQGILGRIGELQDLGPLPRLAAEERGDVCLVIDDEDADAHAPLPAAVEGSRRGKRTVNSVNAAGSLSTVIVPAARPQSASAFHRARALA